MDAWWKKESLIKFESPTSIFIAAPSGSGKTVLTKSILQHADGMFNKTPKRIYYCYTIWQSLYTEMQKDIKNIYFHQGLPTITDLNDWGQEEGHKILVLDDLMIKGWISVYAGFGRFNPRSNDLMIKTWISVYAGIG